MKKIGIFYGSSTGVTAEVAQEIAKKLGVADADVHNVAKSAPSDECRHGKRIRSSSFRNFHLG